MAYTSKPNQTAITIDGLAGVYRALGKLGAPVEEIREANREAGLTVMRTAKNIAPVRSSKLRNSIRVNKATTNVKILAGYKRVPYANPIHWGWFLDKRTGVKRNIKPNPFLARALGYNREQILQDYVKNLEKLINKYKPPIGKG
jgi:hypothetical protein